MIIRYIKHFGAKRHPREMGVREIEPFLSHFATTEKVSAATQRQALNAKAASLDGRTALWCRTAVDGVHPDVKTTEIYTHVMQKNLTAVQSPLDRLHDSQPHS